MKRHFLALDLGSTYTKCALLGEGRVLCEKQLPAPDGKTGGNRWEADGNAILTQCEAFLTEMRDKETCALLISTQMHGCILTDEKGFPLSPYYSWQDRMGAVHLADIRGRIGEEAARPSGVPVKGNLAMCALMGRLLEGEKLPENAFFHTLGSFLIKRLTGSYVCHMTNAAPTGLADIPGGGWNRPLIQKTGLGSLSFPGVETGFRPVGTWNGIAVFPDLGDQQACAFGADLLPGQTIHLSVGTAGLMGILTPEWGFGAYENRPWIQPGLFLRTVSGLPGGRDLGGLKNLLCAFSGQIADRPLSDVEAWDTIASVTLPEAVKGWRDLLCASPEEVLGNVFLRIGQEWGKASEALEITPSLAAFSGGSVRKNRTMRRAILRGIGLENDCGDFDILQGMHRLSELAEKEL